MRIAGITNLLPQPRKTLEQDVKIFENGNDPYPPKPTPITFLGYNSKLKTLWKAGKLPQVKYGFYGDKLTIENCSVEHIQPVAKGGLTVFDNIVIASKNLNNKRGDKPLKDFINFKAMAKYFEQFINLEVDGFNGNNYIAQVMQKVGKVLQRGE